MVRTWLGQNEAVWHGSFISSSSNQLKSRAKLLPVEQRAWHLTYTVQITDCISLAHVYGKDKRIRKERKLLVLLLGCYWCCDLWSFCLLYGLDTAVLLFQAMIAVTCVFVCCVDCVLLYCCFGV